MSKHIWLMIDQIVQHTATKVISYDRAYHKIHFDLSPIIGMQSDMWEFPDYEQLQILPVPKPLTQKFAFDISEYGGVNLKTLKSKYKNMEIADLPYPVRMPADWKKIGDIIMKIRHDKMIETGGLVEKIFIQGGGNIKTQGGLK